MRKPLIIALHGFGSRPDIWSSLLPLLSQHGNVATPFLPGHMNTVDDADIGVDAFALRLIQDHPEFSEQPVILMGHSLGGMVAAAMAEKLPQVLGVITVDTPMIPAGSLTNAQKDRYAQGFFTDYPEAAAKLLAHNLNADVSDSIRQQLYDALLDLDATFAATLWRKMFDWTPNLEKLHTANIPLHAINGGQFPKEQSTLYQSLWQETVIADANHYPMIETPEAFSGALEKILDELTK